MESSLALDKAAGAKSLLSKTVGIALYQVAQKTPRDTTPIEPTVGRDIKVQNSNSKTSPTARSASAPGGPRYTAIGCARSGHIEVSDGARSPRLRTDGVL